MALRRLIVGEEAEPARFGTAQQEVAALGPTLGIDGGQDEGVGLDTTRLTCLTEPRLPLDQGVGIDVGEFEAGGRILEAITGKAGKVIRIRIRVGNVAHRGSIASMPRM